MSEKVFPVCVRNGLGERVKVILADSDFDSSWVREIVLDCDRESLDVLDVSSVRSSVMVCDAVVDTLFDRPDERDFVADNATDADCDSDSVRVGLARDSDGDGVTVSVWLVVDFRWESLTVYERGNDAVADHLVRDFGLEREWDSLNDTVPVS